MPRTAHPYATDQVLMEAQVGDVLRVQEGDGQPWLCTVRKKSKANVNVTRHGDSEIHVHRGKVHRWGGWTWLARKYDPNRTIINVTQQEQA